jgi:hypothetical protein
MVEMSTELGPNYRQVAVAWVDRSRIRPIRCRSLSEGPLRFDDGRRADRSVNTWHDAAEAGWRAART